MFEIQNKTRIFMEKNKLCFVRIGDEHPELMQYFLPFEETQIYRNKWFELDLPYYSSISRSRNWQSEWKDKILMFLPESGIKDTEKELIWKMEQRLENFRNITTRPILAETGDKYELSVHQRCEENEQYKQDIQMVDDDLLPDVPSQLETVENWWTDNVLKLMEYELNFIRAVQNGDTGDFQHPLNGPTVQLWRSLALIERIELKDVVFCVFYKRLKKDGKVKQIPFDKNIGMSFIYHIPPVEIPISPPVVELPAI